MTDQDLAQSEAAARRMRALTDDLALITARSARAAQAAGAVLARHRAVEARQ